MPNLRRPLLSNFPHLHNILRNDARANAEFNAAITSVSGSNVTVTAEQNLKAQLSQSELNLQEYIDKYNSMVKLTEATVQFIRLLGETIEVQTELTPYTEDIVKIRDYTVHFTAAQIRLALHLHWDVIGRAMESQLARSLLSDPAAEREGT